ncbi:MAG: nucleic acid-binding protein [Propionibacterium sp.]|nr:nucleic acid-binding protein [Propionibacterium sp.]
MKADSSAQRALLQVADLDTQMARLRHQRTTLPEHAKLSELQTQRGRLSEQIVAAQTRISDAEAEQERVEIDLVPARARLERNQQKVDAGMIAAKALQPMLDEIEHLRGRIATLEDNQLEIMQQVEDETAICENLTAERSEIENQMRELLASRNNATAELDIRITQLSEQRANLTGRLPADLMALYEKIAQRVGGTGAAELRARRCGGCGLELDVSEVKRQAAAAPDDLLRCEECGRILVRTENSGL